MGQYIGRVVGFVVLIVCAIGAVAFCDDTLGRYTTSSDMFALCAAIVAGLVLAYVSLSFAEASIRKGVDYKIPGGISFLLSMVAFATGLYLYAKYTPSVERYDEMSSNGTPKYYRESVLVAVLADDLVEKKLAESFPTYLSYDLIVSVMVVKGDSGWVDKIDPEIKKRLLANTLAEVSRCVDRGNTYSYTSFGSLCTDSKMIERVRVFKGRSSELEQKVEALWSIVWDSCHEMTCYTKAVGDLDMMLGEEAAAAFQRERQDALLASTVRQATIKTSDPVTRVTKILEAQRALDNILPLMPQKTEALAARAAMEVQRAALIDMHAWLKQPRALNEHLLGPLRKRRSFAIDSSMTYMMRPESAVRVVLYEKPRDWDAPGVRNKDEPVLYGAMLVPDYDRAAELKMDNAVLLLDLEGWVERITGRPMPMLLADEAISAGQHAGHSIDLALDTNELPAHIVLGDFPDAQRASALVWLATTGRAMEEIDRTIRFELAKKGYKAGNKSYTEHYASAHANVEKDIRERGYHSPGRTSSLIIIPAIVPIGSSYRSSGYRPSSGYSNRAGSRSSSSYSRSSSRSGSYGSGK